MSEPVIGRVDLPSLAESWDKVLWPGCLELARQLPRPWVLIGGIMVFVHGALNGRLPPRITRDIDILFDVRAIPQSLRGAVRTVEELGYQVDGISADGLAHRYVRNRDGMIVDILAPDNLGSRIDLTTSPPGRAIEVPGGSQAIANRVAIQAQYDGQTETLFVPGIAWALAMKAAAYQISDQRKHGAISRHLLDITFLASLVDNPGPIKDALGNRTKGLKTIKALDDSNHPAWRALGSSAAEDGYLVWRYLRQALNDGNS